MKKIESENKFVDKSSAHGMFQFDKDGTLRIGGVIAYMTPMSSVAIQYHLMGKYFNKKKLNDITYYTAKIQGIVAVKLLRDKFGIKSKKEIFFTSLEQGGMAGLGKDEVIRFNEKDKHILLKKQASPYEDTYTKLFGYQKDAIGHYFRGLLAGVLDELFGEDMIVIENKCRALRNSFCIEEAFPRRLLKTKNLSEIEKAQVPDPETDFPEVGRLKNVLGYLK